MKKVFFISLAVAALLTSCSKEEPVGGNSPAEVAFSGNLSQVLTRVGGGNGTVWDAGDQVGIYMIKADPGTLSTANVLTGNKAYTASVSETSTAFTPVGGEPILYPSDGSNVKFIAYYPRTTSVSSDFKLPVSVASQSNLPAIDVLYAPVTTTSYSRTTTSPVPLQFAHKLAKLVFNISNGTGVTEPVTNGITVSISAQQTAATVDLTDGTVAVTPGTPAAITATGNATVEAIVLPSASLTGIEFTFTNNEGRNFKASVPAGSWLSGYKYTYTVTLQGNTSEPQADVTGMISQWNDGGTEPITGNEVAEAGIQMILDPSGLTRATGGTARLILAGVGTAVINWGDGGATGTHSLSATPTTIDHPYAEGGQYTVTIAGEGVTHLNCSGNQVSSLDISRHPALLHLDCSNNHLTTLDLSNNTLLENLIMGGNNFALTTLDYSYSPIKNLDLSGNTSLVELNCWQSQIETLNVSGCTALTKLDYRYSRSLASLNVNGCTALKVLWGDANENLASLDVSTCTALEDLSVFGYKMTEFDVRANTLLKSLFVWIPNRLTEFDVRANILLNNLSIGGCGLTALDVSQNTQLTSLQCYDIQLTELDVSNNLMLEFLNCDNNLLTMLNLSANTSLTSLHCDENQLEALDVSNHPNLHGLSFRNNQLTYLDVRNNQQLFNLMCSGNQLTELDLSHNQGLIYLSCEDNEMNDFALNNLFFSLHSNPNTTEDGGLLPKEVIVVGNPGAWTCNTAIAEERGWTVRTAWPTW